MKGIFELRCIYAIGFTVINYVIITVLPWVPEPNSTTFVALLLWSYELSKGRIKDDK